jgi:hypothetical protein
VYLLLYALLHDVHYSKEQGRSEAMDNGGTEGLAYCPDPGLPGVEEQQCSWRILARVA